MLATRGAHTATFTLPAGDYEYKVAGGSWDASLQPREQPGEPNIAYFLKEETAVTFYYNHATHRVWNNVSVTRW